VPGGGPGADIDFIVLSVGRLLAPFWSHFWSKMIIFKGVFWGRFLDEIFIVFLWFWDYF
jgi:hypothetical protein